nr:serine hydrolase [uncultured Flavobacterium sp.]
MSKVIKLSFLLFLMILISCKSSKNILNEALASPNEKIQKVMQSPKEYELQIIYSKINRNKNNEVTFEDYTYNLEANAYFYPASTVKFPIALMALEKLNTLPGASMENTFEIDGNPAKYKFTEEITKVFAVSDNEASNHLFELIGFDYLNEGMAAKGLSPFRISHRISVPDSGNPLVRKVTITKQDGTQVSTDEKMNSISKPIAINNVKKGKGYYKEDVLINEPFDFSQKNYFPLATLHNTMKRIVFPDSFKESERFNLTKEQRDFVLFSMSNLPKNAGYDPKEYYDGYCKFFMFGDTKENIPSNIKIYNKVGDAYGTLIDCAYIVDEVNNVEFMVSATLLVNKDGIFNDDRYDYDTIGFPFLAELGRQLYAKNLKK